MENIFIKYSIGEIIEKYRNQELTSVQIAGICLDRIKELEDKYKAWVCFDEEKLLAQAKTKNNLNNYRLLEGIPVGVKDIFNTYDFPTQMGSPLWKDFEPGNDARVVFNIKRQGAIIPGKTVTAEFAVHTLDKTLNPHDITKTPGTSSSGSAVAIALGMVPVALGTQTAGSIVRPASFCGVYGCKPSFGLIPRTGILKTTDSLDTIGFFTIWQKDLKRIFDSLRVSGADYPFSDSALNDQVRQNKSASRPWRVAFVKTHTWENAAAYAQKALMDFVEKISAVKDIEISEVELPKIMRSSHEVHATIYNKTLSYYFKNEFTKSELVSPIMNDLIRQGNNIGVENYQGALKEQEIMQSEMDAFFDNYDIIISLSTAGEAPLRDEVERSDPALIWTLAHLPVVSVPKFISPNNMPFGLQIVARKYNDYLLFDFIDYLAVLNLIPKKNNPLIN